MKWLFKDLKACCHGFTRLESDLSFEIYIKTPKKKPSPIRFDLLENTWMWCRNQFKHYRKRVNDIMDLNDFNSLNSYFK